MRLSALSSDIVLQTMCVDEGGGGVCLSGMFVVELPAMTDVVLGVIVLGVIVRG